MLWCGLRTQEVAALRYEDIDQINRTIHVQRALKADGSVGATKSKAGNRIVPIPPQLWPRLRLREGYLFRDTLGNRMTRTSIRKAWAMFKRHMDINMGAMVVKANGYLLVNKSVIADDLEMYDLRHTYCTDLQAAGVPIDVARYLMGHSDISMTSRIYTHMREDTFADAAAKNRGVRRDVRCNSRCNSKTPESASKHRKEQTDLSGSCPVKSFRK